MTNRKFVLFFVTLLILFLTLAVRAQHPASNASSPQSWNPLFDPKAVQFELMDGVGTRWNMIRIMITENNVQKHLTQIPCDWKLAKVEALANFLTFKTAEAGRLGTNVTIDAAPLSKLNEYDEHGPSRRGTYSEGVFDNGNLLNQAIRVGSWDPRDGVELAAERIRIEHVESVLLSDELVITLDGTTEMHFDVERLAARRELAKAQAILTSARAAGKPVYLQIDPILKNARDFAKAFSY